MFACPILKLHVHAAGKAAAHLRRIREKAAVGVNGLVEQVVGFDVPIPLAIARIAAVVCAEVEHMVSGRARFVAGEFVLGEHAVVVQIGIDTVGQRGFQVEAEARSRNTGGILVVLCDERTVAVGIFSAG